jgi:hypothetical protein
VKLAKLARTENRHMRTSLVERAQDGDDVAFSDLVDLDGDLCYAIAYRILRDAERAQDADTAPPGDPAGRHPLRH